MILSTFFSTDELRSLLLRSMGVAASAAAALISLKVFLSFEQSDAATFLSVIGWMTFIPLAHLGLGKPSYSEVRSRYSKLALSRGLVQSFVRLFVVLALFGIFFLSGVSLLVAKQHGFSGSFFEIGLLTMGLTAMGVGVFQRDLAYSVSKESNYEYWEAVRRLVILGGYCALYFGAPLWIFSLLCLTVALWSHARLANTLNNAGNSISDVCDVVHWRQLMPTLGSNARRYFFLSINEILIYNLPLVIFTITTSSMALVFFVVWMRLFQLLVLPMRMVIDARINRQMSAYFRGDSSAVKREIQRSLWLGSAIMLVSIWALFVLREPVLSWVGASTLVDDSWLLISLMIWGLGNVVQHVFGSFTLGNGKGFGFSLSVSFATLIAMTTTIIAMHILECSASQMQLALGVVYLFSSLAYVWHTRGVVQDVSGT